MMYDVIIVGAGASGLTAAAYLTKAGHKTLILEKEPQCGGLVNSFTRDGFTFDGGLRALDDAGVLFPMLKKLGLELEFVKNRVSIGIEDQVIDINADEDINDYQTMLQHFYPESRDEIASIIADMKKMMHFIEIQYGINNPLFLDIKEDRDYFIKKVFPWMFKFALTAPKIAKRNLPVVPYLKQFTQNQSLIDIIAQHFFTATPAYFALSYFKLYQDYHFPKGGTGVFVDKLVALIEEQGGEIRNNCTVEAIDPEKKIIKTSDHDEIAYRQLLWTADQKTLYKIIDTNTLTDQKMIQAITEKRAFLADKSGSDSIFTLYVASNLEKQYFKDISAGHFFYTPKHEGQSKAGDPPRKGSWEEIKEWLDEFFAFTTYEIAIPALRDPSLAPEGKTGLIISVLFDYQLTKHISEMGWESEFKAYASRLIIKNLEEAIYPGLSDSVIDQFAATPLTIQRKTGSTDGAITGWAFTNDPVPAESRLPKIGNAVNTPLPDIFQAGQWTYSPSGFPVALITGKLASDKIDKQLKK